LSLFKNSTRKYILPLFLVTLAIISFLIIFPSKNKELEIIKNGHFEGMPNKTVAELVNLLSASRAKWSVMELLVDNKPKKLVVASWENIKGKEYKILFNYPSPDNNYVTIYEIFINDEPRGWIAIARFLDIFGLLDKGLSPKEVLNKQLKEQEKNIKIQKKESVYEKKDNI